MTNGDSAFVGSIPQNYDRYLGSIYFSPYADDLVERLHVSPLGLRVLETACGTGILTERLVRRLAGRGAIVATDLNEPMLAYAKQKRLAETGLEWRQADATKLPFDDASFDAALCQFGLMFFTDKMAALRETFRVLRRGGRYLASTWDSMDYNTIAKITHETVAAFFPGDPPQSYTVPFSLHEPESLCAMLRKAGFRSVKAHTVSKTGFSPTAAIAATGLIEGHPIYNEIMQRRPAALDAIKGALTQNLVAALGDQPMRCPLRAFIFEATKP